MDPSNDPQLGLADVDRSALHEQGLGLTVLASQIGARLDESTAVDAPAEGWRVLRRYESGQVLIGAPVDAEATSWRVAHVQPATADTWVRVHPETMPLRASRAQRRKGLALRWPDLMANSSVADDVAIDIVNVGEERWTPDGDGFHVVGVFTAPGSTNFHAGWWESAQSKAVPLDPGEYARVHVSIAPSAWDRIEPGVHDLHAVLVSLGLRSHTPLTVNLTAEVIRTRRQQNRRPTPTPAERRRALDEEIARLRGQLDATAALDRVAAVVAASDSDESAIARLGSLLRLDGSAATAVYHSALQQLSPGNAAHLRRRLDNLELRAAGTESGALHIDVAKPEELA